MFSSTQQLQNYKPTMLCDIFSLLFVAYYFVENGLPWTDYIDLKMEVSPNLNLYDYKSFKQIRLLHEAAFHKELEKTNIEPLQQIFVYMNNLALKQTLYTTIAVDI